LAITAGKVRVVRRDTDNLHADRHPDKPWNYKGDNDEHNFSREHVALVDLGQKIRDGQQTECRDNHHRFFGIALAQKCQAYRGHCHSPTEHDPASFQIRIQLVWHKLIKCRRIPGQNCPVGCWGSHLAKIDSENIPERPAEEKRKYSQQDCSDDCKSRHIPLPLSVKAEKYQERQEENSLQFKSKGHPPEYPCQIATVLQTEVKSQHHKTGIHCVALTPESTVHPDCR